MPPEDQNRDDMAKTTNEQLKEKDAEIKRLRKAKGDNFFTYKTVTNIE